MKPAAATRAPVLLVLLAALLTACATQSPTDAADAVDGAAEAVGEGRFDPGSLVGEEITVTGEVAQPTDGAVFRLSGDEFGEDGLAVVVPDGLIPEEGALAEVTGVVTEADLEAISEQLGAGVSEEDLADLSDRVVLAAQDVTTLEPADVGDAAGEDLAAQLRAEGGFDTFLSGLSVAGLEDVVRGDTPTTLFVPGDAAFTHRVVVLHRGVAEVQALLEDPERVDDVLRHHAVEGTYSLDELRGVDELTTVDGHTLPVSTEGDQVLVGGVPVTGPTYRSDQVVAHVIGGILDPGQR